MDRAIQVCYDNLCNLEDDYTQVNTLNENVEETGIILVRKVKSGWDKRILEESLNAFLKQFYFINISDLNMKIANYILDSNLFMTYRKEKLRIGISPMMKEKTLVFSDPYAKVNRVTGATQYCFRVEKVYLENSIKDSILTKIEIAGKKKIDILVFPEMLGTRKILQEIMTEVNERKVEQVPKLIVFPSIWEKTEQDANNMNISCLVLNGEEIIFEQPKRKRFHYKKGEMEVYEDINCEDNNILNVLHIDGIGRLCIVICYDFLQKENRQMILNSVYPSLICSPSFSTGSFDFNILKEAGFAYGCNWVWCNTCSAMHETEKLQNFNLIGIVTTLSKECNVLEPDSFQKLFEGVAKCGKENCKECLYYTDIPLKKNFEDNKEVAI